MHLIHEIASYNYKIQAIHVASYVYKTSCVAIATDSYKGNIWAFVVFSVTKFF